jgi:CRISPR-associated protein Csb1
MRAASLIYERAQTADDAPDWTADAGAARKDKNQPKKLGKDGKPSEANHGNVPPGIASGGFTLYHARQTTVVSLTTLRRLRFPLNGEVDSDPQTDRAARTVLAALSLLGAVLAREEGADLRSRCQLVPAEAFTWELLDSPGEAVHRKFTLTGDQAVELFNAAVGEAAAKRLPWEGEITLTPSEDLIQLVAKSQELAMHQAEGSE